MNHFPNFPVSTYSKLILVDEPSYKVETELALNNLHSLILLEVAGGGYELQSNKGIINGYASLDGTGKVPANQLPSYVDDVIEYPNVPTFPVIGETGKIYLDLSTNNQYRWTGTVYVQITNSTAVWGNISGLLANQTDLITVLNGKESNLTFNTGLIRTGNNITNNLITGFAGGQSIFGGVAANENLIISSTLHGTKGIIQIGSTDLVNIGNAGTGGQRIVRIGQGTSFLDIGSLFGTPSNVALYINQAAPNPTNYALRGTSTDTYLSATSQVSLRLSDTDRIRVLGQSIHFTTSGASVGGTTYQFTGRLYNGVGGGEYHSMHLINSGIALRILYFGNPTVPLQRDVLFESRIHSCGVAGGIINEGGTFAIQGASIAGDNMTMQDSSGLLVNSINVVNGTGIVNNSYAGTFYTQTGAANNRGIRVLGGGGSGFGVSDAQAFIDIIASNTMPSLRLRQGATIPNYIDGAMFMDSVQENFNTYSKGIRQFQRATIHTQINPITITGIVTNSSLYSNAAADFIGTRLLPANFWNIGTRIEGKINGVKTPGAGLFSYNISIGGVTLAGSTTDALNAGTSDFVIEWWIVCISATQLKIGAKMRTITNNTNFSGVSELTIPSTIALINTGVVDCQVTLTGLGNTLINHTSTIDILN